MADVRLVLNSDDLARVRLLPNADPIDEMIIGAHSLRSRFDNPVWAGWARRTVAALGPAGAALMDVMDSGFIQISDLTRTEPSVGHSFDETLESILSAPRRKWRSEVEYLTSLGIPPGPAVNISSGSNSSIHQLGKALQRFHQAALDPYWPAMSAYAASGRDTHMRLLAEGGVDRLLAGLHPNITWQAPILTIRLHVACPPGCIHQMVFRSFTPTGNLYVGGRGLTLLPSVFASSPTLRIADPDENEPFVLTYPVAIDWANLIDPTTTVSDPLVALMGSTRALVLQTLAGGPLTTSELARAVRVSVATASEHATVLRTANLVESNRDGNRVRHRVTTLGSTLVHSTRAQVLNRRVAVGRPA